MSVYNQYLDAQEDSPYVSRAEIPPYGSIEDEMIELIDDGISPASLLEPTPLSIRHEVDFPWDAPRFYPRVDNLKDVFRYSHFFSEEDLALVERVLHNRGEIDDLERQLDALALRIMGREEADHVAQTHEDDPIPVTIADGMSKSCKPNPCANRRHAQSSFKHTTRAAKQYLRHRRSRRVDSIRFSPSSTPSATPTTDELRQVREGIDFGLYATSRHAEDGGWYSDEAVIRDLQFEIVYNSYDSAREVAELDELDARYNF